MGAGWGEGSRDSKDDGFLAFGEVGDGYGLEFVGGVEVGEGSVGELVADGDGGGGCGGAGGGFDGGGGGFRVVAMKGSCRDRER